MQSTGSFATANRGFTLVELLVALLALAIMAAMSWQSIDGLIRTQQQTRAVSDDLVAFQAGLAQWDADLNAMTQTGQVSAVEFDGRTLRLTRRNSAATGTGVRVVAWTIANQQGESVWSRWQSPPASTRGELSAAWAMALNPSPGRLPKAVSVMRISNFSLLYYRNNAWSNPLSTAEQANAQNAVASALAAAAKAREIAGAGIKTGSNLEVAPLPAPIATPATADSSIGLIPDGVRLILNLSPGQALVGELRKDWVRPQNGGGKST